MMAAAQRLPSKRAQAVPMTRRGSASSTPALAQMSRYCMHVEVKVVGFSFRDLGCELVCQFQCCALYG